MGSGMFPFYASSTPGQKLKQAADMVDEVLQTYSEDVYTGDSGGGQFDNAATDGGSLALLRLAVQLIRAEVRE